MGDDEKVFFPPCVQVHDRLRMEHKITFAGLDFVFVRDSAECKPTDKITARSLCELLQSFVDHSAMAQQGRVNLPVAREGQLLQIFRAYGPFSRKIFADRLEIIEHIVWVTYRYNFVDEILLLALEMLRVAVYERGMPLYGHTVVWAFAMMFDFAQKVLLDEPYDSRCIFDMVYLKTGWRSATQKLWAGHVDAFNSILLVIAAELGGVNMAPDIAARISFLRQSLAWVDNMIEYP